MRFKRARVVPVLLLALAGAGVVALQSPANAAVTSTNITSPTDGTYFLVDSGPYDTFTVTGTTDATSGNVDIRCYTVGSSDWVMSYTAPIQVDGTFSKPIPQNGPYGTCRLLAVPQNYPAGSSLAGFTGPKITTEYQWTTSTDYSIAYQGAHALFDLSSATHGGYWDSRLDYPDGSSSNYLWDSSNASLKADRFESRSRIRIDGRDAYGPYSASQPNLQSSIPGGSSLARTLTRDGVTGVTRITEKNPLVRCPVGTAYPPTAGTCSSFSSAGVRLERSYVITDGGRQVHITDVWRTTDGKSHSVSALYQEQVHGYDYVAASNTDVSLKLPWVSSMFKTFTGDASFPGPSKLASSILLRDSDSATDGDQTLPRGALTFDFPATVHRTAYDTFDLAAKTFTVPANKSRTIRQSFVIGATDAEVLAKAKSNETRINPYRPDAWIKVLGAKSFKGNNVYNTTGASQAVCCAKSYVIVIQNDGTRTDSFRIRGTGSVNGFTAKYLAGSTGSTSITYDVTHGTYAVRNLAPGEKRYLRLVLTFPSPNGQLGNWLVSATSLSDGTRKDAVKATVQMAIP